MMTDLRVLILMGGMAASLSAGVRSGRASADWLSASTKCEPGKAVETAIRLVVDAGWHTYWLNPGEGGMPIRVEWDLPAGWVATEPGHPVPERFKTGELANFGYHGTVLFPVVVTAPAGFQGAVSLRARISWLACDDASCVTGDAGITLKLQAGKPAPTTDAELIKAAFAKIPRPRNDLLKLRVTEQSSSLQLSIQPDAGHSFDMADREVFPATPEVIDPAAEIQFAEHGGVWTAELPKSEYAATPVRQLTLVISAGGGSGPVELTWKAP